MGLRGINVNGTNYAIDYDYLENKPDLDSLSSKTRIGTMTLGTTWAGSGPYSQEVTLPDITPKTKVDVQPDATTISMMADGGITAIWVENDEGTLTAWCAGSIPTDAITLQCTMTEVTW